MNSKSLEQLNKSLQRYFRVGIAGFFALFLLIMVGFFGTIYQSYSNFNWSQSVMIARDKVMYYDEVLTMSARMTAFTGDIQWLQRYDEFDKKLEDELNLIHILSPNFISEQEAFKTEEANRMLVQMERNAMLLATKNRRQEGTKILFSKEYENYKSIYSIGIQQFQNQVISFIDQKNHLLLMQFALIFLGVIGLFLCSIILWQRIFHNLSVFQNHLILGEQERESQNVQLILLGEIAAGIAHDINSPLAVIHGHALLLEQQLVEPEYKTRVAKIARATNHALSIVKNLRDLSRKEQEGEEEWVAFSTIVEDSLTFSEKRLKDNGVHIIQRSFAFGLKILCRPTPIKQVMINLIQNSSDAIKHLEPNQKWIRIEALAHRDHVLIAVVDSGKTPSPEVQSRLFETQFTTKVKGQGTGLGLALSRKLVVAMKGDLYLDTDSPNTRFVIELPQNKT